MRREHIALPTLQLAATAFLVSSVQAKIGCVDANSELVAPGNCDGTKPVDTYFFQGADPNSRVDSSDPVARKAAGLPESGLVAGGFGKRFTAEELAEFFGNTFGG